MKVDRSFIVGVADEAILRAFGRYHYLTASQVCRLRYSAGTLNYARERLKRLADAGYLLRRSLPVERVHGSAPIVYTLARGGRTYLGERGVILTDRFRPHEKQAVGYLHLNHLLAVNDLLIALERLCDQRTDITLERMVHDQDLKAQPIEIVEAGKTVSLVPDGWVSIILRGRVRLCFAFELDCGTVDQRKWRLKIRRYLNAVASGTYEARFGTDILTVAALTVRGAPRMRDLVIWTEREVRATKHLHEADLFRIAEGNPEQLHPDELFLRPIWSTPFANQSDALFELTGIL